MKLRVRRYQKIIQLVNKKTIYIYLYLYLYIYIHPTNTLYVCYNCVLYIYFVLKLRGFCFEASKFYYLVCYIHMYMYSEYPGYRYYNFLCNLQLYLLFIYFLFLQGKRTFKMTINFQFNSMEISTNVSFTLKIGASIHSKPDVILQANTMSNMLMAWMKLEIPKLVFQ